MPKGRTARTWAPRHAQQIVVVDARFHSRVDACNLRRRQERGKSFDGVLHGRRNDDPMMIVEIGASEPQDAPTQERRGIQLPTVLREARTPRVTPARERAAIDLDSEHPVGPGEVEAPAAPDADGELVLLYPRREAQPLRLVTERLLERGSLPSRRNERAQVRREIGGSHSCHAGKITTRLSSKELPKRSHRVMI